MKALNMVESEALRRGQILQNFGHSGHASADLV
jgi:hypothetical protein